ncbi:putative hypoxia- inducible factor prolyl hydroxylase (phd2) [Cardiosporidium cionae]|uniref:Hypoxia- inducible factor prolyl hydroxylase (Phd2) n=1 Tax=Cardiosporidium cionae TaxID=476202 RepID=A0ABQ7JEI9_9APIC|nr:putative hypoxia- inducible factor prolyl hydroxylase (phd2) [Cardiosporidium cionae]|eukprot:KAF8822379.1 putative hypoxia- inducible factor prolyl hydroxylase (phd2) [Cardiosporidium cionae]
MFPKDSAPWPSEVAISFLHACRDALTLPVKRDIERRVRSGSGTEHIGWQATSCCGAEAVDSSGRSIYHFKKEAGDKLGSMLDNLMSDSGLQMIMADVAERAAAVYEKVQKNGKAEINESLSEEEERQIRQEILKESIIRGAELHVSQEFTRKHYVMSRAGGLFANPNALREIESFDALNSKTILNLMEEGVGIQQQFLGKDLCQNIYKEMEFLEYNGSFNEMIQPQFQSIRNDQTCWMSSSDLDRFKQRGLKELFKKMSLLPYELNRKANLSLQMSWMFLLGYYSDKGAFYVKHMDNSYQGDMDNGRKITCIYYPNSIDRKQSDGGCLRFYQRQTRAMQSIASIDLSKLDANSTVRDINPQGDCLKSGHAS